MNIIETTFRSNLLRLARAYAKATGFAMTTVSTKIAGDSRFFDNIAKPESPGFNVRIYERAIARFKENWPIGAQMPEIIEPSFPERKRRVRG